MQLPPETCSFSPFAGTENQILRRKQTNIDEQCNDCIVLFGVKVRIRVADEHIKQCVVARSGSGSEFKFGTYDNSCGTGTAAATGALAKEPGAPQNSALGSGTESGEPCRVPMQYVFQRLARPQYHSQIADYGTLPSRRQKSV